MKIKIFKWDNVVDACGHDIMMLKALENFKEQLELCSWNMPSDIIKSFRTADIITCEGKPFNRVVFNIKNNKHRLICGYKFDKNKVMLYVRFVGSHSEYDKKDACKVNMF